MAPSLPCIVLTFPAIFAILRRWFMPVNILLTFVIGSFLAWILNIIARTPQHLRGLVMGCCAAGTRLSKILLESQFGLFSHARQSQGYHQPNLSRNKADYVCLRLLSLTWSSGWANLSPVNDLFLRRTTAESLLIPPSLRLADEWYDCLCTGNLGNLLLIIIPAVCDESNSPFGDSTTCTTNGDTYTSLSMSVCSALRGPMSMLIGMFWHDMCEDSLNRFESVF